MFSDTGNTNLFAKSSLFGSTSTSLFGNGSTLFSGSSLFGTNKPVFNFSSLNTGKTFINDQEKKEDDEDNDEEGGDDLFEGSNSPKAYNPEKEIIKTEKSDYEKKYVKQIENLLAYSKETNKFVSKGTGYLSIEVSDKDNKYTAAIVFRYFLWLNLRNSIGTKIVEGVLSNQFSKIEKIFKNFKHIVTIFLLQKGKDKFELGRIKIPVKLIFIYLVF